MAAPEPAPSSARGPLSFDRRFTAKSERNCRFPPQCADRRRGQLVAAVERDVARAVDAAVEVEDSVGSERVESRAELRWQFVSSDSRAAAAATRALGLEAAHSTV
jgi:hypothetical protein